jgi:hypothetical protein
MAQHAKEFHAFEVQQQRRRRVFVMIGFFAAVCVTAVMLLDCYIEHQYPEPIPLPARQVAVLPSMKPDIEVISVVASAEATGLAVVLRATAQAKRRLPELVHLMPAAESTQSQVAIINLAAFFKPDHVNGSVTLRMENTSADSAALASFSGIRLDIVTEICCASNATTFAIPLRFHQATYDWHNFGIAVLAFLAACFAAATVWGCSLKKRQKFVHRVDFMFVMIELRQTRPRIEAEQLEHPDQHENLTPTVRRSPCLAELLNVLPRIEATQLEQPYRHEHITPMDRCSPRLAAKPRVNYRGM